MNLTHFTRIVLALWMASGSIAVEAQVKKCVDSQGNVTFTDRPCAANSQQSVVEVPTTKRAEPRTPDAPSSSRSRNGGSATGAGTDLPGRSSRESFPCDGLFNESCRHTHEQCDLARKDPTDSNIAACARAAGYKTTRLWTQISTDRLREYDTERRLSVKCVGVDAADGQSTLDLRESSGEGSAGGGYRKGYFHAEYGGPSFPSWEKAADAICAIRASIRPIEGSRETRLAAAGLVDATCGGRAAEVRASLAAGVSPNSRSYEHDYTALHCAALRGDVALIRDLRAKGAALGAVATDFGVQPIHAAAMSGNLDAVRELVKLGASIDAPSLAGTPVLMAFATGTRLPRRLDDQLGDAAETIVKRRYRDDRVAALAGFEKLGARLDGVNENGENLLMLAIGHRDLALTRAMLARKANPNVTNTIGLPVLHKALTPGRTEVSGEELAMALIDAGANINSRDANGATIQCRAFMEHEFLAQLFARGLDPNTVDNDGSSCWWTIFRGYAPDAAPKLFGPLRNLRTPLRADGTPGAGPLWSCAAQNDLDCVNYLLKRGLKPVDVGPGRQTVMHVAARNSGGTGDHDTRRRALVRTLLKAGAKLDEVDDYGETPLMVARIHDQAFIVFLIEQGADVNAVNARSGKSVLDMYTEYKKSEVVAALRAKGARSAGGGRQAR
jgi:ankyrin repeat protein